MKRKPDFYMINGTIVCGYWKGSRVFAFSRKYPDREYLTLFQCTIEDLEKKSLSRLCKKYLHENEKTWLSQLIDGILKGRIKGPWRLPEEVRRFENAWRELAHEMFLKEMEEGRPITEEIRKQLVLRAKEESRKRLSEVVWA